MAKRFEKKKVSQSRVAIVPGKAASELFPWFRRDWLWGLILLLAVILVYQPVWYAGYIWDDADHVTANPCIIGPLGLKEIWTTSAGQFFPLVLTTFWFEHALWGLSPLPYHLVNVFLHAGCAVLLWRVLRSLQIPGAWPGAALWALHPLQVESVAWISEMKNTESCLFYLLTILFFVRWLRRGENRGSGDLNYALALLCAALAMASKSSTVVLPVVLGLCVWWLEGRWHPRILLRLAPIMLMSVVAIAITLWPHTPDVAAVADPQWARSWPARVATAGDAVWFYFGKLLWPYPLLAVYPRWQPDTGDWISYLPLLVLIAVWFILWFKRESGYRPHFFALTYFLIVMSPFLGLIDQSFWHFSLVEDHLQYLAGIGPLALVGAGLTRLADVPLPNKQWLQPTICGGILVILGMLSWRQGWFYENEETLWKHTLTWNPSCWVGYKNLGLYLDKQGHAEEATAQFNQALKINPNDADVYYDIGNILYREDQVDEAMTFYKKAIEINSEYAPAYNNLGNALTKKGQTDEAIVEYQKSLAIHPNGTDALNNLGNALTKKGRPDEAIVEYQKSIRVDPNDAVTRNNLGYCLLQKGQMDEAMAEFQKALELDPTLAEVYNNIGNALAQRGRADEAAEQFQKALELKPTYAEAHFNLGNILSQQGRLDEALGEFRKALKSNPALAEAHDSLGNIFARQQNEDQAIEEYEKALELNPNNAHAHNNLGVAFFQKGRRDEALIEFQKALQVMPDYTEARNNLAKVKAMTQQKPAAK